MSRSNSRNEGVMSMSMSGALGGDLSGLKRTRSLRVSTGDRGRPDISSLNSSDHTVETEDTQFIRAATGRGSIKRGPAPTKASVLRAQVSQCQYHFSTKIMFPRRRLQNMWKTNPILNQPKIVNSRRRQLKLLDKLRRPPVDTRNIVS